MMSSFLWWLPQPPVAIEDARVEDAPALAAIHAACFQREWDADALVALMLDPMVSCLVARRANVWGTKSPIGFLLTRAAADEAEILTIAIDPNHRGRGIARRLIDTAFRRLYRDRITSVFLEVDAGNMPALALYARLGFVKVGERKGYYAGGSTPGASALVMRADLR